MLRDADGAGLGSTPTVVGGTPPAAAVLAAESAALVSGAVGVSKSENTRRAYVSDWRRFERWCGASGHQMLPADPLVVAAYLAEAAELRDEAGGRVYAPATLTRWVAAIGHRHRAAGYTAPGSAEVVAATLSGIRRTYAAAGDRPPKRVAPLLAEDVVAIVTAARQSPTSWAGQVYERRDSALLLMGFAGAFRRSELSGLQVGDITRHRHDGLHVRLGKSKTDQDGVGTIRALSYTDSHRSCPPCAYLRWLQVVAAFDIGGRPSVIRLLRTTPGFEGHGCRGAWPQTPDRLAPVFRSVRRNGNLSTTGLSGAAIHKRIRQRAAAAGYDSVLVDQLGGRSLRAGFVTQAFRNGADAHAIMRQTGHASPAMLEVYARKHSPDATGHRATSPTHYRLMSAGYRYELVLRLTIDTGAV
ncbi:site-specific integrase [Rhodococcus pyridinivorans]|uniref:site-specific integrase n=1 Tax=Rhodococcus pyridinivorans TaxID=103816 RepID=UPI001110523A